MAIALSGQLTDSSREGLVRPDDSRHPDDSRRADDSRHPDDSSKQVTASPSALVPVVANEAGNPGPVAGLAQDDSHRTTTESPPAVADVNSALVKQTFAQLDASSSAAIEYFYARLFTISPDARALFPTSMLAQRERMFVALRQLIESLGSGPDSAELIARLGRAHRRYGVLHKHYEVFFAALRDSVAHFLGAGWTPEASSAWQGALDYISAGMRAAAAAAQDTPPWWVAEIVSHEVRSPSVAVVRLRTKQPFPYQAGQYVPVQVTRWPRIWRPFSVAAAPRPGGLLELHVRAVPGGLVSNTIVHHSSVGDSVLLGAAAGAMTLTSSDRDLLCLAGGTGLAPIKAIIEHALDVDKAARRTRKITLFYGARKDFDLYYLEDLQLLESASPSLRVIPVLSEQPGYAGLTGMLPDAVSTHGPFENTEAYICGPPAMVRRSAAMLAGSIPADQIRHDPLP